MTIKTTFVVRLTVFVVVMLMVMSISFLVEARDLPATSEPTSVPTRSDQAAAAPIMQQIDLVDIADGLASWYGGAFHGRRTASGRRYNMHEMTAAHRNLPFGSLVRVVNPKTQRDILVEITDRGPFIKKRVIDLSQAAAKALGVSVTPVELQALRPADIAAQYTSVPNSLIVIDTAFAFHTASEEVLELTSEPTSFTAAIRALRDDGVVVILPAQDGRGYSYATAVVRVPVQSLDTINIASVR